MKFGLFNLMTYCDRSRGIRGVIDDTRTMVGLAEQAEFDVAWFAEHHFMNYSISVSPLMMATYLASTTTRIRLGSAVVVLPLYHPLRIAQEIALLDQLSEGRVVLGVGTGYQKYELERYGKTLESKTEVFLEYWSIVEQVLTEGRAAFTGKHICIPETVITVRTQGGTMPDLYCTSPHPGILRRLSRHSAIPFITAGWRGSSALNEIADQVKGSWIAAGLDPLNMPLAVQQYVHIADSRQDIEEAAKRARYVGRMVAILRGDNVPLRGSFVEAPAAAAEPSLEVIATGLLIGDPHTVAERLVAEIRRLQPIHYSCFFQFGDMPLAKAARSIERFVTDVVPLVEKEVGPLVAIGRAPIMQT
jgi:alkanesulfonate monooxygenase SsuD/methylene tetrahydromethanopterin reductase-like flavin-dependent oxidoreductase (luciferase family)